MMRSEWKKKRSEWENVAASDGPRAIPRMRVG